MFYYQAQINVPKNSAGNERRKKGTDERLHRDRGKDGPVVC